jgi:hypothetical protein
MDAAPFRRGRALFGFMGEQEASDFLRGTCVLQDEAEFEAGKQKWASASEAVAQMRRPLRVLETKPISHRFDNYLQQISEQQAFKQTCGGRCALQQIEVENLVAFQRYVDIEHATDLASKMKAGEQSVIESCLPLSFQQNLDVTFDPSVPGAVSFSSFSPKLVFTGIHISGVGGPQLKMPKSVEREVDNRNFGLGRET